MTAGSSCGTIAYEHRNKEHKRTTFALRLMESATPYRDEVAPSSLFLYVKRIFRLTVYFFAGLVCAKALPATDFDLALVLPSLSIAEAFVATRLDVCFVFFPGMTFTTAAK